MNRLEIILRDLSPLWIKIIGILIVAATGYNILTQTFFTVSPLVYLLLNTLAVVVWTGKVLVVIDFKDQTIGEGFRILGLTYLDKDKFTGVEKIFINKVNSTTQFQHFTTTTDIHHETYKAFLKTLEGLKVCIGTGTDKDTLIRKLQEYNAVLKTDIFDQTLPYPDIV